MAQTTISAMALLILLIPLLSAGAGGAAAAVDPPIGMPNCVRSCGGVEVPYPFGIGTDARCYLPGFNLTCDNTGRLLLDADGTLQVLDIRDVGVVALLQAQHNGAVKVEGNGDGTLSSGLRRDGPYTLVHSELILTGCNVQATVKSGNVTVASCTSICHDKAAPPTADDYNEDGSITDRCSGGSTGCCREKIVTPDDGSSTGTSSAYDVHLGSVGGRNGSADLPVRVFVAEQGWFDNSSVYSDLLQTRRPPSKETMAVPVLLTWEVVGPPSNSVCKSNHSERTNGTRGGYACRCSQGYQGNPYLIDGCKDENECKKPHTDTGCYGECINTEGSFICRCPPGTTGNHSIPGGCVDPTNVDTGVEFGSDLPKELEGPLQRQRLGASRQLRGAAEKETAIPVGAGAGLRCISFGWTPTWNSTAGKTHGGRASMLYLHDHPEEADAIHVVMIRRLLLKLLLALLPPLL